MISPEALAGRYEDLANHFARQGESRRRDECLVLAADAALAIDLPEEAERLRKRLLLTNPQHLLRSYHSMEAAMRSSDVRDLIDDLRKRMPPATVEKLLNRSEPSEKEASRSTTAKPPKASKPKTARTVEGPGSANRGLMWVLFTVWTALAGGFAFLALFEPLLR